jgi:hypothetical protein
MKLIVVNPAEPPPMTAKLYDLFIYYFINLCFPQMSDVVAKIIEVAPGHLHQPSPVQY